MRILVTAKAPVPGLVKTRLARDVGDRTAAGLAAAALLDTIDTCVAAVGAASCHLALAGDLAAAVRGEEISSALARWTVRAQRGRTFADRLATAHAATPGPVLQIGMDTPQVTPADLTAAADLLEAHDAVVGPAYDGGWWLLGLQDPTLAARLRTVPMSQPDTCARTIAALASGVVTTRTLRDVDTIADAAVVARTAPRSRFARSWQTREVP
ncbi:DUF2064 domain-containing protein [Nocardioides sp. SLBN-35]|uniref:TIGR04282 family arsenosugar biosynthesis glycosyltransferase n=1 Tax=Nocardioides sp. SLBN-35 TaxID=2768445 RepID=UPI001C93194E|nr:DUF2064 domain-containing protein [Nocardioides sp. SLBN-35]